MCPSIKIEEKHTYLNFSESLYGNNRSRIITTPNEVFRTHEPYWPVQGTDENNRIGRKIQTQSIHHEGYLALPLASNEGDEFFARDTILDAWNGYQQDLMQRLTPANYTFPSSLTSFSIPIRHLWIEFYDDEFKRGSNNDKANYLVNWFKALTIQIGIVAQQIPSIQTKMLRESTSYTGDFKILKDTMYWLSPGKPIIHFNEDISYKRTLSFDAEGADPTNSHIYSLWIAPTQPSYDYFNIGFGFWIDNTTENPVAEQYLCATIQGNIKLKYIDI